jgi:putative membrane protein
MAAAILWLPYCGAAPVPAEIWSRWNLDPWLIAGLMLAAILFVWRSSLAPREANRRWSSFAAAWLLLVLLFISPFCALTSALFSARVVHHVLLVTLVAPLLVWAFPRTPGRGAIASATAAQAVVFWLWHAPPVYAWALSGDAAYWLMQASLLGVAVAFWSAVRRAPAPAAAGALLGTMVQMGLLGALITFASRPLYAPHFAATAAWGYSPLEDQQIAGLVMWAPAAGLYLGAALWLLARWIGPDLKRALPS